MKRIKNILVILLVFAAMLSPALLAEEDNVTISVETQKQLYRGQFWRHSLESVEIGREPNRTDSTITRFDVVIYGQYEIVVFVHHYMNTDFATWDKYFPEGTSAVINVPSFEGRKDSLINIYVFDIYLYENGILVDSMHFCHNFQDSRQLKFLAE